MNGSRAVRLCLLPVVALVVAGCGFHLRTWNLEGNVETARITSNPRNPLAEPLGRALESAGVTLVEDAGSVDVVVELLADERGRRSVSVTDQARAAEYETSLRVRYAVRGQGGETLLDPTWIHASRIYQVDRDNLVGSNQEQTLLEREMVTDLVQQVIRGVNAVTREGSGAP